MGQEWLERVPYDGSKKGAVSQGHSQPAAARLSPQTRLGPPLTGWRRKGGGQGGCTEAKCVWCRCTPTRGFEDDGKSVAVRCDARCDGGMTS
jgi:hypothetical protein